MGADHGRRLYLYQLPLGRRFHERTRIFKRPAFRMRPRCRSAEKERRLHSLCRGTEAGISCRSEVSDPQGLQQTDPTAESTLCTCRSCRMPHRRNSGNVPDIREYRRTALSSTAPISARLRTIGCRGSVRLQRSTESRLKSFTSPTKKLRRTYPRRSRPMPCSGTENS